LGLFRGDLHWKRRHQGLASRRNVAVRQHKHRVSDSNEESWEIAHGDGRLKYSGTYQNKLGIFLMMHHVLSFFYVLGCPEVP